MFANLVSRDVSLENGAMFSGSALGFSATHGEPTHIFGNILHDVDGKMSIDDCAHKLILVHSLGGRPFIRMRKVAEEKATKWGLTCRKVCRNVFCNNGRP